MRRGLSYARLVEALAAISVEETEVAIKNKVSCGHFTFLFFFQAMAAIGADWMQVPPVADLAVGQGVGDHGAQELANKLTSPRS